MSINDVNMIVQDALFLVIRLSAPILLVSLIVGLVVSIFQTVTSIQEQTLTFVPKVILTFLTIILLGNWIATSITEYITGLWSNLSIYIR
ncbi:MAG: flagellar biosynthesis protein FliQ [Lachnospiraceae bacterium]|jgi:flagellar biosynthetic protein FliQ|nr:flagellar biosynthesis protein FliQ [Lachnospiraceae bacterium]